MAACELVRQVMLPLIRSGYPDIVSRELLEHFPCFNPEEEAVAISHTAGGGTTIYRVADLSATIVYCLIAMEMVRLRARAIIESNPSRAYKLHRKTLSMFWKAHELASMSKCRFMLGALGNAMPEEILGLELVPIWLVQAACYGPGEDCRPCYASVLGQTLVSEPIPA